MFGCEVSLTSAACEAGIGTAQEPVGLIREVDGKKLPSVLEFEHEFAVANLPAGELTVTIEGLDSSGQVLPQTTQILRFHR